MQFSKSWFGCVCQYDVDELGVLSKGIQYKVAISVILVACLGKLCTSLACINLTLQAQQF